MDFNYFKSEIERTYRVLGLNAWAQNYTDLKHWLRVGYINQDEYEELAKYNRELENSI